MNKRFSVHNERGAWVRTICAESKRQAEKYLFKGESVRDITDTMKQAVLDIYIENKATHEYKILTITEEQWFFLYEEAGLFEYNGYCFVCDNDKIHATAWLDELWNYEEYFNIDGWYPSCW